MNVTLTSEAEQFIHGQIKAGRFTSAEQAVQEAIHLLMDGNLDGEWDDETMAAINEAQGQIARGDVMDKETFRKELFKQIGRGEK